MDRFEEMALYCSYESFMNFELDDIAVESAGEKIKSAVQMLGRMFKEIARKIINAIKAFIEWARKKAGNEKVLEIDSEKFRQWDISVLATRRAIRTVLQIRAKGWKRYDPNWTSAGNDVKEDMERVQAAYKAFKEASATGKMTKIRFDDIKGEADHIIEVASDLATNMSEQYEEKVLNDRSEDFLLYKADFLKIMRKITPNVMAMATIVANMSNELMRG